MPKNNNLPANPAREMPTHNQISDAVAVSSINIARILYFNDSIITGFIVLFRSVKTEMLHSDKRFSVFERRFTDYLLKGTDKFARIIITNLYSDIGHAVACGFQKCCGIVHPIFPHK